MKSIIIAVSAAVLAPSAVGAQTAPSATHAPPALTGDQNKIVCESEEKIGTRLGEHRVCMTVAEWNDKRRAEREFTDQVQSGAWGPSSNDPRSGGFSPH